MLASPLVCGMNSIYLCFRPCWNSNTYVYWCEYHKHRHWNTKVLNNTNTGEGSALRWLMQWESCKARDNKWFSERMSLCPPSWKSASIDVKCEVWCGSVPSCFTLLRFLSSPEMNYCHFASDNGFRPASAELLCAIVSPSACRVHSFHKACTQHGRGFYVEVMFKI